MSGVTEAQPDHAAAPSSSKVPTSPPSPSTSPAHKRSRVTKEADDAHVIGYDRWAQQRKDWTRAPEDGAHAEPKRTAIRSGVTYDDLLLSSAPFPEPIALQAMVDFLVEAWNEEGLYE